MANEDRLPGVEFTLESSETKKVKGKLIAEVHLIAHINDLDVFSAVEEKLDGLRIYTVEDFQTQVNSLLREDNERLEEQIRQSGRAEVAAKTLLMQKESFHAQEVQELQEENRQLGQRVDQLGALERELQDLARS